MCWLVLLLLQIADKEKEQLNIFQTVCYAEICNLIRLVYKKIACSRLYHGKKSLLLFEDYVWQIQKIYSHDFSFRHQVWWVDH